MTPQVIHPVDARPTHPAAARAASRAAAPLAMPRPRLRVARAAWWATALTLGGAWLVSAQAAPSADAVPGDLLVKLQRGNDLGDLLRRHPVTLASRLGARPIVRLRLVGGADPQAVLSALRADPAVQLAEPNLVQRPPEATKNHVWAIGTPHDYASQWAWPALRLTELHRLATGEGVKVAILDTGTEATHPALAGRVEPGVDWVDGDLDPSEPGTAHGRAHGHGTHVAGIVARVAPGARLVSHRVLDAQGVGSTWAIAEALLRSVDPDGNPATDDGAQVVNLSLGGPGRTRVLEAVAHLAECGTPGTDDPVTEQADPGYEDDRRRCAASRGALVVAAAGNDGSANQRFYPAAEGAYGLVAVAATRPDGRLAGFSNAGGWIDLAAPGEGVTSSVPGGGWASWSGTSMAAPMVAGVAAVLRSLAPGLSASDLKRCLVRSGSPIPGAPMPALDALRPALQLQAGRTCR